MHFVLLTVTDGSNFSASQLKQKFLPTGVFIVTTKSDENMRRRSHCTSKKLLRELHVGSLTVRTFFVD